MGEPLAVFVYGTLKRGDVREKCWPRTPVKVEGATVRGELYDLGPYPGLIEGDDVVAGELWSIAAEDVAATLAALDEVEGFRGAVDDLYRRVVVECRTAAGVIPAWTYLYARASELRAEQRILPDREGVCGWTRSRPRGSAAAKRSL